MEAAESGFGDAFVSAREQMGLSQREVAEELKLAWKTIESLESEDFESLPPCVSSVDMLNPIQSLLVLMQTRWPQS